MQRVGAAKAVSLAIGHNPGQVTPQTQDTSKPALNFADLRRMTGRVNPTWYEFNSRGGFELRILGSQTHHPNHKANTRHCVNNVVKFL